MEEKDTDMLRKDYRKCTEESGESDMNTTVCYKEVNMYTAIYCKAAHHIHIYLHVCISFTF